MFRQRLEKPKNGNVIGQMRSSGWLDSTERNRITFFSALADGHERPTLDMSSLTTTDWPARMLSSDHYQRSGTKDSAYYCSRHHLKANYCHLLVDGTDLIDSFFRQLPWENQQPPSQEAGSCLSLTQSNNFSL